MAKLEESGRKRAKRRNIRKAVLNFLNNAAIGGDAAVSRRLSAQLRAADAVFFEKKDWGQIARTKRSLIAAELVYERDGFLHITKKGKAVLERIDAAFVFPQKPRSWDGRWRLLIFDIPEARKAMRNKIRQTLIAVGFLRLQNSVWIYPHDCEDYVTLLKADLKIGQELLYIIADEIEGVSEVKKQFGLK